MVTFNQTNKFYKRRNSGKYAVDVYELNQMFMQNQVLKEKASQFRNDRIENVINQTTFPNLETEGFFFIHIIPFGFLDNQVLDFSIAENDLTISMTPMYSYGYDKMYNIDGFATFCTTYDRQKVISYNQLFRNGIYEIFTSGLFYKTRHQKQGFNSQTFVPETLEKIKEGISYREFKQNQILFPFIQIPTYNSDIYELLKPNYDILWQSFGYPKSPEPKK